MIDPNKNATTVTRRLSFHPNNNMTQQQKQINDFRRRVEIILRSRRLYETAINSMIMTRQLIDGNPELCSITPNPKTIDETIERFEKIRSRHSRAVLFIQSQIEQLNTRKS